MRSEWSPEELVEEAPAGVRDPGLGAGQHALARCSWRPIRRFDARHITPSATVSGPSRARHHVRAVLGVPAA